MLQGKDERLWRRWVHKVEVNQVIDAQTLEHENHIAQVSALDLRVQTITCSTHNEQVKVYNVTSTES